jgi:hypothetical protein
LPAKIIRDPWIATTAKPTKLIQIAHAAARPVGFMRTIEIFQVRQGADGLWWAAFDRSLERSWAGFLAVA